MPNRNLRITSGVFLAGLLALVIWRFSGSSQVSSEKLASSRRTETALSKPQVQAGAGKPENAVSQPTGPGISDLLTDEKLSESAVRSGLSKIAVDGARKAEERNEALSHLLNLTGDENQDELIALVRDPALGSAQVQRIFEDAFNRSHSFQADLCLELMTRRSEELLVKAARDHLLFLLGSDVDAASDLMALKVAVSKAKKNWAAQEEQ